MPTGIYIRTKEHRKKTSEGLIGRKVSKETREKIRKTLCSHKNIEGGCRSLEYIRKQRKEYRHRLGISKRYREEIFMKEIIGFVKNVVLNVMGMELRIKYNVII